MTAILARLLIFLMAISLHVEAAAEAPGHGAIIDVHSHLPRGLALEDLIRLMDDNGISMTVLTPVFYGANRPDGQGVSDENLVLEYFRKKPDRIIPFFGMQRPILLDRKRWEEPDAAAERLLKFAESQLSKGEFRGIGEFILCHYPYLYPSGARGELIRIPADTPLMKRFIDLAAKYQIPVLIHYEIDDESLPSLKRLLEYNRSVTIILAHNGGRADIQTLSALLNEYKNVHLDWSGMTHFGGYGLTSAPGKEYKWYVKNPIEDGRGHLLSEWKNFAEKYQDRIVGIGFDGAHPEQFIRGEIYTRAISAFRTMLSDLSPGAADKIGRRNALGLFRPERK